MRDLFCAALIYFSMEEKLIISIPSTKYHIQKNIGLLNSEDVVTSLTKELGYYLIKDGKIADCYRNNKTIETKGTSIQGKERNLQSSINTLYAKPCGSDCVMFQIVKSGKDTAIKLNCTKTRYLLSGEVINEFPIKVKIDAVK